MKIPQVHTVVINYNKDKEAEDHNNKEIEIEPVTAIKITGSINWDGTIKKFEWVSRLEEKE